MKLLTEIYTPLTKNLQDLNQEIRQKLSYMPLYTEQEMKSLEQWLKEVKELEKTLENLLSLISHHTNILKIELKEKQEQERLKG